jgi:FdhD protein
MAADGATAVARRQRYGERGRLARLVCQPMYRAPIDPERIYAARVTAWEGDQAGEREDLLAAEEPLDLRLGATPLAVIMRTPGHDDELALGFLHGEGIIHAGDDVEHLGVWRDEQGAFAQNRVTVRLRDASAAVGSFARSFYATSSCGMCGKASVEAALLLAPPLARRADPSPKVLFGLPGRLREAQRVFDRTGGLHAAGLFDLDGTLCWVREDVGRHNAVDKLIGRALLDGALPLDRHILFVSGRVSFELVQKALAARIPIIAAVSAPSSLAVQAAQQSRIALVGFLRNRRCNIYC